MSTAKKKRQKELKRDRQEALVEARRKSKQRRWLYLGGVIVAILIVAALVAKDDESKTGSAAPVTSTTSAKRQKQPDCPKADGSSKRKIDFPDGTAPSCLKNGTTYKAKFTTSEGTFVVDLDRSESENGVNAFVYLARYHYYDDTKITRTNTSIDIIQGGSPHTQDNSDPGPSSSGGWYVPDETKKYAYLPGDLVYARTSQPNGSSAQFFFASGEKVAGLDSQGNYIKFGNTKDLSILEKIMALHEATDASQPDEGKPSKDVTVQKVEIIESN